MNHSINLYWISDSTVQYNSIKTYPQTGMGQVIGLFLKPEVNVHNHAKNGRSTKSFLAEGRFQEVETLLEEGDIVLIQFGHNDQKKDEDRGTKPYEDYYNNLLLFVQRVRERKALPVLITPLYRRYFDDNHVIKEDVHGEYPKAMQKLALAEEVPLIDLTKSSYKLLKEKGDEPSKEWFMNFEEGIYSNYPDGHTDNTHLRTEGAVQFAGLVAKGLYELGGVYRKLLLDEENKL